MILSDLVEQIQCFYQGPNRTSQRALHERYPVSEQICMLLSSSCFLAIFPRLLEEEPFTVCLMNDRKLPKYAIAATLQVYFPHFFFLLSFSL